PSHTPEDYIAHTPGLKVVLPRNPYQATRLLRASIKDQNPAIFFEPKRLYRASPGEVPEEDYTIELGTAEVTQESTDIKL
ncbi:alpha-ketoacid dehydrogenase subunit beta, partial [Pseudoalteromonas sp. SIMBA_148]